MMGVLSSSCIILFWEEWLQRSYGMSVQADSSDGFTLYYNSIPSSNNNNVPGEKILTSGNRQVWQDEETPADADSGVLTFSLTT